MTAVSGDPRAATVRLCAGEHVDTVEVTAPHFVDDSVPVGAHVPGMLRALADYVAAEGAHWPFVEAHTDYSGEDFTFRIVARLSS